MAGLLDLKLATAEESVYDPSGTPLDAFLVLRLNPDVPLPGHSNPIRGY